MVGCVLDIFPKWGVCVLCTGIALMATYWLAKVTSPFYLCSFKLTWLTDKLFVVTLIVLVCELLSLAANVFSCFILVLSLFWKIRLFWLMHQHSVVVFVTVLRINCISISFDDFFLDYRKKS